MSKTVRVVPIDALKITDRAPDAKIYQQHVETVERLKEVCAAPFSISAVEAFKAVDGSTADFVTAIGGLMRSAVQSGNVFDFGVIDNQSIAAWDHKAALRPIAKLPWNGPAMFLMSHPDEVPTDRAVSVYVLLEENGMLLITELMFVSASGVFLLYQSLWAKLPVGSDRAVTVIAHSEPPSPQTVDSTLPPAIMGIAFLDAEARGHAS